MASGTAPRIAAIVVIRMGRKRSWHALKIASLGLRPSVRSASIAKSIIMMAFFFTIPIRSKTPISAIRLNARWNIMSASTAPMPAEGSVERIVNGWA